MQLRGQEKRTYSDRYVMSLEDSGVDENFWRRALQSPARDKPRSAEEESNELVGTGMRPKAFGPNYDVALRKALNITSPRFQTFSGIAQVDRMRDHQLADPLTRYLATRRSETSLEPASILDAPGLRDDFYLNLLDWSSRDHLAVALESTVYLWEAQTGLSQALCQVDERTDYVASVCFTADGSLLACGNAHGCLSLIDVETGQRLQNYHIRETGRIATITVSSDGLDDRTLSMGTRSGKIFRLDPRDTRKAATILTGHGLEFCGLKQSPVGHLLASGGNDNLVCVWDVRWPEAPVWTQEDHGAAVKALAWCPWKPQLLATGGGTADRRIRFWDTQSQSCIRQLQTESQVCGLLWSPTHRELVSTHGFSCHEVALWHYPSLQKVTAIKAHDSRVLQAVMSRDGQQVVTAAANEHLKFWNLFPPVEEQSP